MTEQEEFEFRLRLEQEQAAQPVEKPKPQVKAKPVSVPRKSIMDLPVVQRDRQHGVDTLSGLMRGAGSIGTTLMYPFDKVMDIVKGNRFEQNAERREALDPGIASLTGADPKSPYYQTGKIAGEIAGTAGAGGVLGNTVARVAPGATGLANALRTGGMVAGKTPGAANLATRIVGGGITGGTMAGMVDPEQAKTGALIGAAMPPAMIGVGKVGHAIGRKVSGPPVPDQLRKSVESAHKAGYVIPPSQAKPTLANRALEGLSGKITTAQNASARNQQVTNALAKKAIGADSLDDVGLQQVRDKANAAYDQLGRAGLFKADSKFAAALDKAGASSAKFRSDFPELANNSVDDLISGMKGRSEFDAQSAIEAIKRLRADARANRLAIDNAAKQELGRTQSKVAEALEDLVDRNLQQSGNKTLLANYRNARQTLAKVYDVEKALNKTSGNVDATKLAKLLQKNRPLTGELKTIADFGNQFPKAAQTVERMGSLPQTSPLDWAAMGTLSALTQNPAMMAGMLLRPAARSAALSSTVQGGLSKAPSVPMQGLLSNPELQQLLYRSAPVIGAR